MRLRELELLALVGIIVVKVAAFTVVIIIRKMENAVTLYLRD